MKTFINRLCTNNRFEFYAPFLRVFIGLYLIKDIVLMWEFNGLIYKRQSFLQPDIAPFLKYFHIETDVIRGNFDIFYGIYIILILLFLLGIGKKYTVILLFFCLEVIQNFAWLTLNGGDNLLKFVLLYFIFINSYSRFSLKAVTHKSDFSRKISTLLSNLAGYSLCFHFCLVYFISAIHKINADVWFNGVATYYVLGSERFQGTPWNIDLVKNGFFVTLSTYGTIFIELLFPFFVWIKKTRWIMLTLAISLHSGIAVFMMLYDFQILFILLLGFFLTKEDWIFLIQRVNSLVRFIQLKINLLKIKNIP